MSQRISRNLRAVIGNSNGQVVIGSIKDDVDHALLQGEVNHGIGSISHQVDQDLLHLLMIGLEHFTCRQAVV